MLGADVAVPAPLWPRTAHSITSRPSLTSPTSCRRAWNSTFAGQSLERPPAILIADEIRHEHHSQRSTRVFNAASYGYRNPRSSCW